jgi:hypothetical protein
MSKTRRSPLVSCGSSTSTKTPSRSCAPSAVGRRKEGADAGGGGAAAPPLLGSRERPQADLASLHLQVRKLRRRSALAAAAAAQLALELVVSYHSDEFAEAQDAQRALAAAAALCGAARHAAADADECLAGIDPKLPGLLGQR